MSFIRVTRKANKQVVELNINHIIAFEQAPDEGTMVSANDGLSYDVVESTRQIRSFIKKAQGLLPVKTKETN